MLVKFFFFETDNNQVMAHTANEIFLTGSKLYELEKILPWYFSRISKSAILNVKKVYAITRNLTASSLIEFEGTPKHPPGHPIRLQTQRNPHHLQSLSHARSLSLIPRNTERTFSPLCT